MLEVKGCGAGGTCVGSARMVDERMGRRPAARHRFNAALYMYNPRSKTKRHAGTHPAWIGRRDGLGVDAL